MASLLGNGTTLVLSSGSVGTIVSLDPPEETLEMVPDDVLTTTVDHELIPGKLKTIGPLTGMAVFNPSSMPPMAGAVVTATITFPLDVGQSVAATYAGTAFITRRKPSAIELDTRILLEFSLQFDGKTGPVYSAGS